MTGEKWYRSSRQEKMDFVHLHYYVGQLSVDMVAVEADSGVSVVRQFMENMNMPLRNDPLAYLDYVQRRSIPIRSTDKGRIIRQLIRLRYNLDDIVEMTEWSAQDVFNFMTLKANGKHEALTPKKCAMVVGKPLEAQEDTDTKTLSGKAFAEAHWEEICDMYQDGMSGTAIENHYRNQGVNIYNPTIYHCLRAHGVRVRSELALGGRTRVVRADKGRKKLAAYEKEVIQLYKDAGMSSREVASFLASKYGIDCGNSAVLAITNEHGITRTKRESAAIQWDRLEEEFGNKAPQRSVEGNQTADKTTDTFKGMLRGVLGVVMEWLG